MTTYRKLRKVTWAPDVSLCQIQLFSSEDCPSKVGLGVDALQQCKHPRECQSGFASNNLPHGILKTNMKRPEKLTSIPSIKWKCPPKVELNPNWLVASGEQSKEVVFQKHREMKVFEAVYPSLAYIPHSPSGALCKDGYLPDDRIIPTIRTSPIEDDESTIHEACVANSTPRPAVSDSTSSESTKNSVCANSVQTTLTVGIQEMISSSRADVGAAASAALTALLKSNEIGSSIDTDILIDIFNNPETVSMLLNMTSSPSIKPNQELVFPAKTLFPGNRPAQEQVLTSVNISSSSTDVFSSASASGKWGVSQIPTGCSSSILQPRYVSGANTVSSQSVSIGGTAMPPSPTLPFRKPGITHEVTSFSKIKPFISSPAVTPTLGIPTQVKDANYYKNLIKRHGFDNQNSQGKILRTQQISYESAYLDYGLTNQGQKPAKNIKLCTFHNTPKGCRKGLECPFLHITSSYQPTAASNIVEVPNAKRMKLGRSELTNITMI